MKNKVLALDPGTKTIGVAISDPDLVIAFAREPIPASKNHIQQIINLCEAEGVSKIVVGKLHNPGQHAPNQKLISDLKDACDLDIIEFDEDFSTQNAIKEMKSAGYSDQEITQLKDSFAARNILEQYIMWA